MVSGGLTSGGFKTVKVELPLKSWAFSDNVEKE